MLSKSQISLIKSLQLKKYRKIHKLFIVEGIKSITEFVNEDYTLHSLYYISELSSKVLNFPDKTEVSSRDLRKISTLANPQGSLALFQIPDQKLETPLLDNRFHIALDFIQDPGNLGTIIRTADWFGMNTLICSEDTVDAYSPKVVQASMGSLARVMPIYCDLEKLLTETKHKVYAAMLDGTSIYDAEFSGNGLIVLGNEGNGISSNIEPYIQEKITIPRIGKAESLNVAISSAIICSEISRKTKKT